MDGPDGAATGPDGPAAGGDGDFPGRVGGVEIAADGLAEDGQLRRPIGWPRRADVGNRLVRRPAQQGRLGAQQGRVESVSLGQEANLHVPLGGGIALVDQEGELKTVARSHTSPERERLATYMDETYPRSDRASASPVMQVLSYVG